MCVLLITHLLQERDIRSVYRLNIQCTRLYVAVVTPTDRPKLVLNRCRNSCWRLRGSFLWIVCWQRRLCHRTGWDIFPFILQTFSLAFTSRWVYFNLVIFRYRSRCLSGSCHSAGPDLLFFVSPYATETSVQRSTSTTDILNAKRYYC